MTTNEKRKEIARRLRKIADQEEVSKMEVRQTIGLYMGSCKKGYSPESVIRLADLIEPLPERTCKKRNHDTDSYYMKCFSCSLCNAGWFEDMYDKPFSYCPHCGAKVVE